MYLASYLIKEIDEAMEMLYLFSTIIIVFLCLINLSKLSKLFFIAMVPLIFKILLQDIMMFLILISSNLE